MVVDLRLNKKGLLTAEAFVCLSITLLLVTMITSIVQAKYAQHTVFDRTIRKMEESLIEKMKYVEGCLQACQIEKDSPLDKDSFNSRAMKPTNGFSLMSKSIFMVCIVEIRTLTHSRKYLANSADAF